jgi:AmmeMemoRadiSam system protein A
MMPDEYTMLAQKSLEHTVRTGDELAMPADLSSELLNREAGVFVSLHRGDELRGCIGTIAPTTQSIAQEIAQNAVSAGLSDPRFPPITVDELAVLSYKVDVLGEPESIDSIDELDPKRYGVIVTSGWKRGLLLPDLEGIDTAEKQVDIARRKAGISAKEPVKLERFEVIRHE